MIERDCSNLLSVPVDTDWSEQDRWRFYEATFCHDCRKAFAQREGGYGHRCKTGDVYIPPAEGPVMNYYYPIALDPSRVRWAARRLARLPVCVVLLDDSTAGLALTGGGMDLSWEICEAYRRLGFWPPVHFADLPRMGGRDTPKDRNTLRACRKSCKIVEGWMRGRRENLAR